MESNTIISFDKVSIYHNDNLILANVCLAVNNGEFVYLIGKTGSGKSSLLKALYADIPVCNGSAIVAGHDLHFLRTKDIPYLRRKLGIVFQDFQLLMDRTVAQNLLFVLKATGWKDKKAMQKRIGEVLAKVNLETKANSMPHKLSGGEQQRVGIARALLNDPGLILADEPTGNLDPETSEGIIGLLADISKAGSSILMATHNYSFFDKFPARVLTCSEGNIRESR